MQLGQFKARLMVAVGVVGAVSVACIKEEGDDTGDTVDSSVTDDTGDTDDSGVDARICAEHEVLTVPAATQLGWEEESFLVCNPNETPGQPCPDMATLNAWQWVEQAVGPHPEPDFCSWSGTFVCGPEDAAYSPAGSCCYEMTVGQVCEGRPLQTDAGPQRAQIPAVPSDDLGRAWLRAALDEHASVASFARFVLELMALGAPPDLVLAATQAQADEARHAQGAFALAAAAFGRPVEPGPIDLSGVTVRTDPLEIALGLVHEACVNETVAAALAGLAAERATDPAARAHLEGVAADEAAHAELGWRSLRWLLAKHPELLEPVRAAFDDALARPWAQEPAGPDLSAHGHLSPHERRAFALQVRTQVVAPCAHALLG